MGHLVEAPQYYLPDPRTSIAPDLIWFKSDFTRKDLFERLKYLEPQEPMRETFLYNDLMFSAVGYIIELKSGKSWEQFVRERILVPLDMNSTTYTISEMVRHPDHGVPFREKRDSFELYRIPTTKTPKASHRRAQSSRILRRCRTG